MVNACTIIARNYLAHARVLVDSFLGHHPDGTFTLLLVDDEAREFDAGREPFRCLRLADIGLDRAEIGQLASIYDVTELATAVKPPFLRYLIGEGRDHVIYLDPDIRIFRPLDEASRLARQHAIVLTPHTTVPVPSDGRSINAFQILGAGVYNLGFIAAGTGSLEFIDWWWERTRREARSDPLRMMFTDQRWVDFVPGFFNHFILKDPTYNVAYWNLHARTLTWDGQAYSVNGQPLTFFHFSGFDHRKPYLLSKHQGDRPRILLSEHPAVAEICRDYLAALEHAGLAEESCLPYGWSTLPSGIPFDRMMRRLYQAGLEDHEKGRGPEPPNPLDGSANDRFIDWLNEPAAVGLRPRVSRYLDALYRDRPDLQKAFPDLSGDDGVRYVRWVRTDGVVQEKIPLQLVPSERATERTEPTYTPVSSLTNGVNIAGYFRAEVGVGEAARLLTTAIEAAGIPHSTLAYDATPSRQAHPFLARGNGRAPHDVSIICVNADQTLKFAAEVGPRFFEGRYTVGYWFWELERFPPAMHAAFDCVDEVWTATRFAASGIRAIGRRPVYTIPVPLMVPRCLPTVTRESLGLPAGFMFLFVFDFFSVLERKNPLGLIAAFQRAFRTGEGPILVLKTINGDSAINGLEKVRAAAGGRPDIIIIDEYYPAEEKNALLGLCDCYVSLHRSEGLGLTMAEAMGLEKPVIATAYSGNLDFMTPANSYLVDYVTSAVPAECDPYPRGAPWADPDLDQAAEFMQRVYKARDEAARKARQARHDIVTTHNVEAAAAVLTHRLDDLRRSRPHVAAAAVPSTTPIVSAGFATVTSHLETPLLASLDRLEAQLTPTPSVDPGRRFRGPLLFAQELLFKLLRPYWWQQREILVSLIDAVREAVQTAGRAAQSEPHQRQAMQSLWTELHLLQREAEQAAARAAQLEPNQRQALESLWSETHSLRREVVQAAARSAQLEPLHRQALESLRADVHSLQGQATQAAARAAQLEPQQQQALESLRADLDSLQSQATEAAARAAQLEPQQRQALESLRADLDSLQSQATEAAARAAQLEPHQRQALESLWTDVRSLQETQLEVRGHLRSLDAAQPLAEQRANAVESALSASQSSVVTFKESVAKHLAALTDQLAANTATSADLRHRLYAVPYMDDPDRFHYANDQGRRELGFRSRRSVDGDGYVGFEDVFRGSEPFIRDRFRAYLPMLQPCERVIDIGCGRGEMLDLLREAGVPAVGVDMDEGMVRRCSAKGHRVEQVDAIGYLGEQPDNSVPAIFAAQIVEHFSYDQLMSFLDLSRAKLKPGGQLIFETVNPHALEAFKTFWTDLTHRRPIFPEVAVVWCWLLGFERAYVFFPNGSGDLDHDRSTRGEYAVVETKGGLA